MKYLRTRTNIFETVDENENIYKVKAIKNKKNKYIISRCKVIRESDNLEELCDCFIVEYTNTEPTMFENFYHLQRHHDLYGRDYHHIAGRYGCIWVAGKGLIYVAKMNKDGELELL